MADFGCTIEPNGFTEDGFEHDVKIVLSYAQAVSKSRTVSVSGSGYSKSLIAEGGKWAESGSSWKYELVFDGIIESGVYTVECYYYDDSNGKTSDTLNGSQSTSFSVADDGFKPTVGSELQIEKSKTDGSCAITATFVYNQGVSSVDETYMRKFDLVSEGKETVDSVSTNDWVTGTPARVTSVLHAKEAGSYLVTVTNVSAGKVVQRKLVEVLQDEIGSETPEPEEPTIEGNLFVRGFMASTLIYDGINTVYNNGDVPTYYQVKISARGNLQYPTINKDGKFIKLNDALNDGDVLLIDFEANPPKVTKNGENVINLCSRDSSFTGMKMQVGKNEFKFTCDNEENIPLADVQVLFYARYLGV